MVPNMVLRLSAIAATESKNGNIKFSRAIWKPFAAPLAESSDNARTATFDEPACAAIFAATAESLNPETDILTKPKDSPAYCIRDKISPSVFERSSLPS